MLPSTVDNPLKKSQLGKVYPVFLLFYASLFFGCSGKVTHQEYWTSAFFLDSTTILAIRQDFDSEHGLIFGGIEDVNIKQRLYSYSLSDKTLKQIAILQKNLKRENRDANAAFSYPWLLYETNTKAGTSALFNLETKSNEIIPVDRANQTGQHVSAISSNGRYLIYRTQIYDRESGKVIANFSSSERPIWVDDEGKYALLAASKGTITNRMLKRHNLNTSEQDTIQLPNEGNILKVTSKNKILTFVRSYPLESFGYFEVNSLMTGIPSFKELKPLSWDVEIDLESNAFIYASTPPDVYYGKLDNSDPKQKILKSVEKER